MGTSKKRVRGARRDGRRDLATIRELLATWRKTGDPHTGLVAADALREAGYTEAADDLDESFRNPVRRSPAYARMNLHKRILAEVNGGRFLERGAWSSPDLRGLTERDYVVIYEVPKRRITLWERRRLPRTWRDRRGDRADQGGRWQLWGTYDRKTFPNEQEMFRVLKSDIRYEKLPLNVRIAEQSERGGMLARSADERLRAARSRRGR